MICIIRKRPLNYTYDRLQLNMYTRVYDLVTAGYPHASSYKVVEFLTVIPLLMVNFESSSQPLIRPGTPQEEELVAVEKNVAVLNTNC